MVQGLVEVERSKLEHTIDRGEFIVLLNCLAMLRERAVCNTDSLWNTRGSGSVDDIGGMLGVYDVYGVVGRLLDDRTRVPVEANHRRRRA